VALAVASCTTYLRPVECRGGPFKCNEPLDVAFCEYVATSVEGSDCARLGLADGKSFCVVTHDRCRSTRYALRDADCRVVRYEPVREFRECSPGTPTFDAE
jgi:hypothetical protein